jgi:hypothetical protein
MCNFVYAMSDFLRLFFQRLERLKPRRHGGENDHEKHEKARKVKNKNRKPHLLFFVIFVPFVVGFSRVVKYVALTITHDENDNCGGEGIPGSLQVCPD